MSREDLLDLVGHGHEIEFQFHGKKFSITHCFLDGRKVISFCEAYQYATNVSTANELLEVERDGISVEDMFKNLSEEDMLIY